MITANRLAGALTSAFVEVVVPGDSRLVAGLELVEPGSSVALDHGDLVIGVGVRDADDVLALVQQSRDCAGLVLRQPHADADEVRELCAAAGLSLLAVPEGVGWSAVVRLLRAVLDQSARGSGDSPHVYSDLFDVADTISSILDAPVTVEDARSRVLAYSTGQQDVDEARMATIVSRQVPREVRDHFRAIGVFRRLARSDEPFFVPAGEDGIKARYIVPVRAAGEWLGSVWAVVDGPVDPERERDLRAAAEVVALHLLRLRARGQLQRQVQADQVRAALLGTLAERPAWLDPGPWRVVALDGPDELEDVDARCELWVLLARRFGWRQPLVADLDEVAYAVVRADGSEPGTWAWLADVVGEGGDSPAEGALRCAAGSPARALGELVDSRAQAAAVVRLHDGGRRAVTIEESWAQVVLDRALQGLREVTTVSPVGRLLEGPYGAWLVDTLEAVIDHWGEPQRAAQALGVHPNTVRHRMGRLAQVGELDLRDPRQRLAVRLEIARLRAEP